MDDRRMSPFIGDNNQRKNFMIIPAIAMIARINPKLPAKRKAGLSMFIAVIPIQMSATQNIITANNSPIFSEPFIFITYLMSV